MKNIGHFVDMANTPDEAEADMPATIDYKGPKYPYGLTMRLTEKELAKLDLDDGCEVGDTLHLFAMVRVTSISSNEREDGEKNCSIELQVTHIALEDEDEENEMSGDDRAKRRYGADEADD